LLKYLAIYNKHAPEIQYVLFCNSFFTFTVEWKPSGSCSWCRS